ncbi:MAG: flagellar assembly protein FliW [Burkholderiales bacterium]|nr:flagellar assembly protein FliW [Burkholderiales bacterium]
MQIVTPQFGALDIDEDTIITFPEGMPGFEDCKRFKLLHEDGPAPRVLWLQSIDAPELVMSVIDSSLLDFHYQLNLSDEERALIDYADDAEIILLLTLARVGGTGAVQPNTGSPIVLNAARRKALQKHGVRAKVVFTDR